MLRAIDINCNPFTHALKASSYQHAAVKSTFLKLGIWDKSFSASELISLMDAAGIAKAFLPAPAGRVWEVPYDSVAELTATCPDRLHGLAGIDPTDILGSIRKLEAAVRQLGFVGAHSFPHWFGLEPDDRMYYPLYAKCVELRIPIQIQVGLAYQPFLRTVAHPSTLDIIAVHFPDLLVIALHNGYPWERELIAIADKHENVYIGADGPQPPSKWPSELIEFVADSGSHKVLFGTNYPTVDFERALEEIDALGFDPEIQERLLRSNAQRIYGV